MAVKAYVLVETEVAKTTEVVVALKELGAEIKSIDSVTGPYDIIGVIEVENIDKIEPVIDKIHAVAGVHRTVTCVAV